MARVESANGSAVRAWLAAESSRCWARVTALAHRAAVVRGGGGLEGPAVVAAACAASVRSCSQRPA